MTSWRWDPDSYLESMLAEIPSYFELQDHTVAATEGLEPRAALELGIGTAETAKRILARHAGLQLTAIDSSPEMLERAREMLPGADLRLAQLEDPLPEGTFDLVYTTLAVHHLDPAGKQDLFRRVAAVVPEGGLFVLADVVVPGDPADAQIPIDSEMDLPDRLDDQLEWLRDAGFEPEPLWTYKDLAVVRATRGPLR